MFKDYLFFSNNLQDAARQILEAQEAKAKQYLLEYDPNARKPMPGYTYDGQEPELRSDEDAEKTKEWYTNVVNPRLGSSDMHAYQSEVDYEGRPTGRTSVKLLRVPTEKPTDRSKNKPKEEVEPEIITQKYEPDPEIQKLLQRLKYPSYDKDRKELPVPTKDDLEMARRVLEDERSEKKKKRKTYPFDKFDEMIEIEKQRFNDIKERTRPVPTRSDLAIARLEKLIQHPFGQWSKRKSSTDRLYDPIKIHK
jgi:hypothetical protein